MPDKESGSDEVPGGRGVFGVMTDGGETGVIKSFLRAVSFNEVGGKKRKFYKATARSLAPMPRPANPMTLPSKCHVS